MSQLLALLPSLGKKVPYCRSWLQGIPCAVDRAEHRVEQHLERQEPGCLGESVARLRERLAVFLRGRQRSLLLLGILIHQNDEACGCGEYRSVRLRYPPRDIQSAFIFRDCAVYFLFRIKTSGYSRPQAGDIVSSISLL